MRVLSGVVTERVQEQSVSVQAGIVAFIAATLFLRTHVHPDSIANGQLYSGFLFFTLLQMFFSGIAEMTFAVSLSRPCLFPHFICMQESVFNVSVTDKYTCL